MLHRSGPTPRLQPRDARIQSDYAFVVRQQRIDIKLDDVPEYP
jgi:hypothetical protein